MRIALATYSTRPRGGVVHTLNLAEALAAEGAEVVVHTLARGGDEGFFRPVDPAVDVQAHRFDDIEGESVGQRVVRSIETLAAKINPADTDLVHAQDCISANAVQRCIRTVHHIDQFTTPELVACHDRAIRRPYAHICVSAAVADELRTDWGIDPVVIPNGVEYQRFASATAQGAAPARRRWRSEIGGPFVLAVGGIEPRKGTLQLAQAMAELAGPARALRLVIAGGETLFDYRHYRQEFDELCQRLDVQPIILGPVDHEALPALVAAADVFAFPSTKEGFGLAPLEALAAGRPVVCSDLPVLRETFDGVARFAGTSGELARAIELAFADITATRATEASTPDWAAKGQALAASYRWDNVARQHLDLYQQL